jgi:hypothetical protein
LLSAKRTVAMVLRINNDLARIPARAHAPIIS